jgi:hypothetical protein
MLSICQGEFYNKKESVDAKKEKKILIIDPMSSIFMIRIVIRRSIQRTLIFHLMKGRDR